MNKRRLTQQQQSRITANQADQFQHHPTGIIMARYGKHAEVMTDDQQIITCDVRQNLPSLVVGDHVVWQIAKENKGIILALQPRRSELYRTGFRDEKKLVASNLDQVFITLPANIPLNTLMLDSYLAAVELCQLRAIIVMNKIDLLDAETLALQKQALINYEKIGYPVLWVSSEKAWLASIEVCLNNKVSVFVGPSGAGKSTLIDHFVRETLVTGEVSENQLGKHTTTTARLYLLSPDGMIIDSPGVRGFGLGALTFQQLYMAFVDIKPFQGGCKFSNCVHESESGCVIHEAIDTGKLSGERVKNFKTLLGNIHE